MASRTPTLQFLELFLCIAAANFEVLALGAAMRFLADGPDIPKELLEARDNGDVVFFCGAGVSMPAGLPSFLRLTQLVARDLGVPISSQAGKILDDIRNNRSTYSPPMDQIFGELQRDYGRDIVQQLVKKHLRSPSHRLSKHHTIVSNLSRSVEGVLRIVTTNFDTLFEKSVKVDKIYQPPYLPEIENGEDFSGITYIHGRVNPTGNSKSDLTLGSDDYGRAYLAEGWATRFVRHLLSQYTVYLLGYSADDPPIRYLLEGYRLVTA